MEESEAYPTISIDCLAMHDMPENPHSRLDAWFESLDKPVQPTWIMCKAEHVETARKILAATFGDAT